MSLLFWSRLRNYLYDKGILSTVSAGSYIISVGNLTWGGTGKTALVQELSNLLMSKGLRVAIVSRGYRRNTSGPLMVSDGSSLKASWQQSGDEAYLLASSLPNAIVAVSKKRSEGLKLVEPFLPDVILLDDAFQHRKVKRDLDLVLVDASEDITTQKIIPFGKLREEPCSVRRSDAVILTHHQHANPVTVEWMSQNVRVPIFHANYVASGEPFVQGKRVVAFSGIGAPHHFYTLLRNEGADIVATMSFRDHHVFTSAELELVRKLAVEKDADFIVTTAKDAVRVDASRFGYSLKVMRVELQIAEEALFFDFVLDRINRAALKPISQ